MDSPPPSETWTVIKFLSDNSVEAVPTTWLTDNNECLWPPFTSDKTASAIRSHMDVNTCWPSHKIQIFRNSTYADYATVRQKTKKAEDTSDLNNTSSDWDENISKKRARQPPRRISSSGDEKLAEYKPPPKLKKKKNVPANNNNAVRGLDLQSTPLANRTFKKGSKLDSTPIIEEHSSLTSPRPPTSLDSELLKEVLQQQYLIKSMLKDISSELAKYKQESQQQQEDSESFIEKLQYFPIRHLDDLISFNNFLKDEQHFKSAVNEISRVGGKNNCDFVSRSCSMLLCDSFAKDFSWLGRREKEPFCEMNLARLIIEAAQKSSKSTDRKETEINISNWLRRSNVRLAEKANKF